ncbi:glycosyltransferase, partial [Candidatus Bathyarchaeota archaeon]|nr:glycosyltransferase [Candidatus Bathyarchaeota archaeon]
KMVLVSVIMPSYNHAQYISEAIESVLEQNIRDIELIIIDDCSRDNSKEIILNYAKRDGRIRTIFHEENLGIAKTYNDGLDAAEGKYVAILDSDDVWRRNKLERQLSILYANDDLVVWSEGRIIDREGKPTGQAFTQMHHASRKRKSGDILEILLFDNFIFDSSLIMKKSNADGIRFDHNLKYLNDYKFVVDLAKTLKYYFISEQLVDYRIHGKDTITRDGESWLKDEILVRQYFLDRYATKSQIRADMFNRISSAYFALGEKELARQFILKGLSQKSISFGSPLYIIRLFNSFVGTSLLRLYYTAILLLSSKTRVQL